MKLLMTLALCLFLTCLSSHAQTSESSDTARAKQLNASVVNLYNEGKYDEALSMAKQALEVTEKTEGVNSRSYADALDNIAAIYTKQSKNDDAISFYRRALSVYEKVVGADSAAILRSLYELALLYDAKRDYSKAEPLYQRAVAIKEKESGLNDREGAELLLRYSCVLRRSKNEAQAETLEGRAFSLIYKESGGQLDAIVLPGDCISSKAKSLPYPHYPAKARATRASGRVNVEIMVDESGKVISARALSGHQLLQNAAAEAAYRAEFSPTIVEGKPVKLKGSILYTFIASP